MLNLDKFVIDADEITPAFVKDVNSYCKSNKISIDQFFDNLDTDEGCLDLIGKYDLLKKILIVKPENISDYKACYNYIKECM